MKHGLVKTCVALMLAGTTLLLCGCSDKSDEVVYVNPIRELYQDKYDAYRDKDVLLLKNGATQIYDFGYEKLYSDAIWNYYTYLNVIDNVIVVYTDGSQQNIKDALYSDTIDIQFLEDNGIFIHREPKDLRY